jgi:hypothetical protein
MHKQRGHLRLGSPLRLGREKAVLQRCNWLIEKGIKLAEKLTAATRLGIRRWLLKNE